jgi:hypothetical protein
VRQTGGLGNNYAIRGLIMPMWVLSYVASAAIERVDFGASAARQAVMAAALAFFTLASINEVAWFNVANVRNSTQTYAQSEARKFVLQLNMSRAAGEVPWAAVKELIGDKLAIQLVEKLLIGNPLVLAPDDAALVGVGPSGVWAYQRWQGPDG